MTRSQRNTLTTLVRRIDHAVWLIDAGATADELLAECIPLVEAAAASVRMCRVSLKPQLVAEPQLKAWRT